MSKSRLAALLKRLEEIIGKIFRMKAGAPWARK
jgi:hypothetical protein